MIPILVLAIAADAIYRWINREKEEFVGAEPHDREAETRDTRD